MAGYIGSKAVLLSTTAATVTGNSTIGGNLTVDTDTLFVDAANNNVGIRTTSPSAPLDVVGAIRLTSTANSANFATLSDGGGLVVNSQNNNPMYFYTGGSERMRIDSAGRVTMPYQPSFGAKLATNFGSGLTGGPTAISQGNGATIGVYSNVGSHYNANSGVFTAPVTGQYYAFMQNLTYSGTGYIQQGIAVNGSNYTLGYNDSTGTVYYDEGFIAATIYLSANDQVRFDINYKNTADSYLHSGNYNSFGCYLIG